MKHLTTPGFWDCYKKLPKAIQKLADKNFEILKLDAGHPSLHLKKVEKYYSARIGLRYRALALEVEEGLLWFWIGSHSEYDKIID